MPKQQRIILTREQQREAFDHYGKQVATALEAYDVPDGKLQQVVEFAIETLAKNPNMKVARIVRKAVDKYHLQKRLVEADA